MSAPVQPRPLLLASVSPRRRELLREAGYAFTMTEPPMEEPETTHPHVSPELHAESLAWFKASSVAPAHAGETILAADTIATVDDEIIGKPADREDARRILQRLSDTDHEVMTGVALFSPATSRRMLRHAISRVRVRRLGADEIESYLDTDLWQGKAGAYGIQDVGDDFVEHVEGSFSNVVGLPLELIESCFREWEA
ncbi:MAG: Maf family protein [Phycisphaerae bacterium]